jgi:hypothetical protein
LQYNFDIKIKSHTTDADWCRLIISLRNEQVRFMDYSYDRNYEVLRFLKDHGLKNTWFIDGYFGAKSVYGKIKDTPFNIMWQKTPIRKTKKINEDFSNQDEVDSDIQKAFGITAKEWPPDKNSNVDKKTQTLKKNVKTELNIEPQATFEDNKDLENDDDMYAASPMDKEVLDLYYSIFVKMPERYQIEIEKKMNSLVNSDLKYKYTLSDFEKAWKTLTKKQQHDFGKLMNRSGLDMFIGLGAY